MKRMMVAGVMVAAAVAAFFALRAQGEEPRRVERGRFDYGMLMTGMQRGAVCWQTSDGIITANDLDVLNVKLGGAAIPGAPLEEVFNAVGLVGFQFVAAQKPAVGGGDMMWIFMRTR